MSEENNSVKLLKQNETQTRSVTWKIYHYTPNCSWSIFLLSLEDEKLNILLWSTDKPINGKGKGGVVVGTGCTYFTLASAKNTQLKNISNSIYNFFWYEKTSNKETLQLGKHWKCDAIKTSGVGKLQIDGMRSAYQIFHRPHRYGYERKKHQIKWK